MVARFLAHQMLSSREGGRADEQQESFPGRQRSASVLAWTSRKQHPSQLISHRALRNQAVLIESAFLSLVGNRFTESTE